MNKLEKIMYVLGFIAVILVLSFVAFILIMTWKLAKYDECKAIDFSTPYCEKYKDF